MKNGNLFEDKEFDLFEHGSAGNIIEITHKGFWSMVDNGHFSWSCALPSLKDGLTYEQIIFSEYLESMIKDVECTFRILKGRFAVLRHGSRLQTIEKCDQLCLTCCVLHDRLLLIYGMKKRLEGRS